MQAAGGTLQQLSDSVDQICAGVVSTDLNTFKAELERRFPILKDTLQKKGASAASRREIESRNPATSAGHVRLDAQDASEILLLSDELQLDELQALEYVLQGHQLTGEASADAGAGAFFEERRALLNILHKLLKIQALQGPGVPDEYFEVICKFNEQLMGASGSEQPLVDNLIKKLRDTSLEAKADSKILDVVNARGQLANRHSLLHVEKSELVKCLFYASCIRPRLKAESIVEIAEFLNSLSLKLKGSGSNDLATHQQAITLLIVLIQALLPQESLREDENNQEDLDALTVLSKNNTVSGKLEVSSQAEEGLSIVTSLAWGVMLSNHGPPNFRNRSDEVIMQAVRLGAFQYLHEEVLQSVAFTDEALELKELCAQRLNLLLMDFLDTDTSTAAIEQMIRTSYDADNAAEALLANGDPPRKRPDGIHDFLLVLADVHRTFPDLWQDPALRYDLFGEFMGRMYGEGVLEHSPQALSAYLKVLEALAVTEAGARAMYAQLGTGGMSRLSWARMMSVVMQCCTRYSQNSNQAGQDMPQSQQLNEMRLPEKDADGLAAYLHLFTRIFSTASIQDIEGWSSQLEAHTQKQPLWHVFFQLMCHPVPQKLKAALDEALVTFTRIPGNVAPMFEMLLLSVVVRPANFQDLNSSLTQADLTFQLNEIEARAEDYSETLAFVRLVSSLLKAAHSTLPDNGRPYAHFEAFTRLEVLGQINQRGFRDPSQKWQLMEACLIQLQLWLASGLAAIASNSITDPQGLPFVACTLDLLGERQAARAIFSLVSQGMEALAADRKNEVDGVAKEATLAASLRLLRWCLLLDREVILLLKESGHKMFLQPLEKVLQRDPKRIPCLLEYVRYPYNSSIQQEAILIAQHLDQRLPNMVLQLVPLQSPDQGNYNSLADGFAAALQESLADPKQQSPPPKAATPGDQDPMEEYEDSASLILRLLIKAASRPGPNLAHLLLGFDVSDGLQGLQGPFLDPQLTYSCLTVLMEAFKTLPWLPTAKPRLYASMLELFGIIAADPYTGQPMLDLLRQTDFYLPQFDTILCGALPDERQLRVPSLKQKTHLLHLIALELHHTDAAVMQHRLSISAILQEFFLMPQVTEEGQQRLSRRSEVLDAITGMPEETRLFPEASPESRRVRQRLDLDNVLSTCLGVPDASEEEMPDSRPQLYDVPALAEALQHRLADAENENQRYGDSSRGSIEQLSEVCLSVLRYAQQYNAFTEEVVALQSAVAAWQAVIEVAVTRRFSFLGEPLSDSALPGLTDRQSGINIVHGVLRDTLDAAVKLAQGPGNIFVPALVQVARSLLLRLQDQALIGTEQTDSSLGLLMPAKLHATLQKLLSILKTGYQSADIRLPVYGALLAYFQICSPDVASAQPEVFQAAAAEEDDGMSQEGSDLNDQQVRLEQGNVALIQQDPGVIKLLAQDAASLGGHQVAKMLALTLLGVLVSTDSQGGVTLAIYATGLPEQILHDLVDAPPELLTQAGARARAGLEVLLSQASVLLTLTRSSLSLSSKVSGIHLTCFTILAKLQGCKILSLTPEEPGLEADLKGETLRYRLSKIVPLLLRLVSYILSSLPNSRQAKDLGAAFLDRHHKSLLRILRECVSPAIRTWAPGKLEFEQAALVLQILCALVGMDAQMASSAGQFKAAAYLLVLRLGVPDSKSPAIATIADPEEAGSSQAVLAGNVYWVKAMVVKYLRGLTADPSQGTILQVTAGQPGLPSNAVPTLLHIAALLKQGSEDMHNALESYNKQLMSLRSLGKHVPNGGLVLAGDRSSSLSEAKKGVLRLTLVKAAMIYSINVSRLIFLVENALAVLATHVFHHASKIGSPQDIHQLQRVLMPCMDPLDHLIGSQRMRESSQSSVQQMIRLLKDRLLSLSQ